MARPTATASGAINIASSFVTSRLGAFGSPLCAAAHTAGVLRDRCLSYTSHANLSSDFDGHYHDRLVNVAELTRQIEDKPAPEPLLAVQAFVNTLDVETDTDLLASPAEFKSWLVSSGLATRGIAVSGGDLRRSRELRDTMRALAAANAEGKVDRGASRRLQEHVGARSVPLTVDSKGRLDLDLTPARSVEEFLSLMIGIAFRSQVEDEWRRLKLCRNDECRWAFFDSSRNRGGSWCRMEVCGNRIKNRHYRQRHHKRG